jgi:predicted site-specific integrase-resolvase
VWIWGTPGTTSKQDLDRQIDALTAVGIPAERIYLDKKSGATVDRPGLRALLGTERANQQHLVPVVPARPGRGSTRTPARWFKPDFLNGPSPAWGCVIGWAG